MITGEEILIGVLGNAAWDIVKKLTVKIFGLGKDTYETDDLVNKAYFALEDAAKRFFSKYGKSFGPKHDCFLAREANIEILLRRISLDCPELQVTDLDPAGFNDGPEATVEALDYLIKVFEEELKKHLPLADRLHTSKHFQEASKMAETLERLENKLDAPVTPPPQLLTKLPPRKVNLIGREQDLKILKEKSDTSKRVLLLNGLGGIGKTEVCKRLFYEHYKEYSHAAWVDYVSSIRESFVNVFANVSGGLVKPGPQDTEEVIFEKVMAALNGLDAGSLMIVDNIEHMDDPDLDQLLALPFKVITNSRLSLQGFDIMTLGFLSPESCKDLFYTYYEGETDDEYVEKVIDLCGQHTLTLELLARTAQNAAMSVTSFYELLTKQGFNLNDVIGDKVHTFWHDEKKRKRFFDHLLKIFDISAARVTESELQVLTNLSVLPAIYIPMETVKEWLELETNEEINGLVSKGWLKRDRTTIFMHQVIQEVIRYKTHPDVKTCGNLIRALADNLSLEPDENPLDKKKYVIFTDSLLQHIHDSHEDAATLANNLSMIYKDLGQMEPALEFQKKTVEIFEKILDKNHPDLATSYNNLSMIYKDLGQLEPALEFQKKALKIDEKTLDKNHPDLAISYNNLSVIYMVLDQMEPALEFQKKTLKIKEAVLDKNHPSLATSYNNLSTIYYALGQLEPALEFQNKALEIRERVLDKNHPDAAQSYHNLSAIYLDMKQYSTALEYAQKAVNIMQNLFPNGHPNLDTAKQNLEKIRKAAE